MGIGFSFHMFGMAWDLEGSERVPGLFSVHVWAVMIFRHRLRALFSFGACMQCEESLSRYLGLCGLQLSGVAFWTWAWEASYVSM